MPAKISFQIHELDVAAFNGAELVTALKASVDALKDKDEAYRKMFTKAANQLGQEIIPALVVADCNTIGARDDDTDDCPWAALTRGSGESAKQGKDASGSYGIGKAAAFTATDLRTVLYATAFNVNDHLESRFIGKAILSGHKDPKGNKVTSEGYLGAPGFSSLSNGQIPVPFQISTQGTCLWIPGYKGPSDWQSQVIKIAIANFFHAIAKGELEVTVAGQIVDAASVGGYTNLLSMREKYLLDTASQQPVAEDHINGIGDVSLRITLHEVDDESVHDVALVRDAGMMITRERSKMGPAQFRVPPHWNRFTAEVAFPTSGDFHAQEFGQHLGIGQLLAGGGVQDVVQDFDGLLEAQGFEMLTSLFQGDHATPPATSSYTSRERRSTSAAGICTAMASFRGRLSPLGSPDH